MVVYFQCAVVRWISQKTTKRQKYYETVGEQHRDRHWASLWVCSDMSAGLVGRTTLHNGDVCVKFKAKLYFFPESNQAASEDKIGEI